MMHQRGIASTPQGPLLPAWVLVDGFNVLHAVVLRRQERARWWNALNQERVVRLAESFALASPGGPPAVEVVFDAGSATSERFAGTASVEVRFSPNADDAIVARSRELQGHFHVIVVSADRALLDRARNVGAARLSPWAFEEACGGAKAP
ncbi:MAG: YacP-like domain [Pseudomonadota bacterium]|jgi:predicted RNA-binding protein with PIN domain